MRVVPRGTPNPDADRRFAERAFPLLEPVAWSGDRHRGGYGTYNPGDITTSLALIFGPWDLFVSEPRLAISVGSEFPIDITEDGAAWLMSRELVATRDELHRPPPPDYAPPRRIVHIEIEGQPVALNALQGDQRWIGQGRWREYMVEIHAVCIEPADVHLQLARTVPER